MDEFNKIRKSYFVDGLSMNEIAIKFKRSWATIKKIIGTSRDEIPKESGSRKPLVSTQEVMDAISDLLSEESKLNIKKNNGLEQRKYLRN
jgi:transposase